MASLLRVFLALVGVSALAQPACHREDVNMNRGQTTPSPQRSVETLGKIVTLPIVPLEAWFEDVPEGTTGGLGPTDYLLVAVLRFDKAALSRFTGAATGKRDPEAQIVAMANRPWFPPPVKAAIRPGDAGAVVVRGTMFDGAPFAKNAFATGSFIVVDGGEYAILVLATS